MKVIVLAAGQGTRLQPLTNSRPKCMVEINGKSIIQRQVDTLNACGIGEDDIYIVTGYREDSLKKYFKGNKIHFISNKHYESTNMVCSLICAKSIMEEETEIIVSYGDIVYSKDVMNRLLEAKDDISVIVDNAWYEYWSKRCNNPLDDAETLLMDSDKNLIEIGQKTTELSKIQSQYIGLMKYSKNGIAKVLNICNEAKRRSSSGEQLWRTSRDYSKMYMTDMLQGLIDENYKVRAIEISRGWYEVDCIEDLNLAEAELREIL